MEDTQLNHALQPGPDCLPIDELGRFADGALAAGERARAATHVGHCANCQAELALLKAFQTVAVRDDEAEVVRRGVEQLNRRRPEIFGDSADKAPWLRRWMSVSPLRPASAMAAVLLLVIGSYYLTQPAKRLPSGSDADVTRSLGVTATAPVGDQSAVPERLVWQPVSSAQHYRVRLTEVDRHELWAADAVTAAIDLPPAVRAQIVPGKTLLWQVTAYGPANEPIGESEPQRFRLTRSP